MDLHLKNPELEQTLNSILEWYDGLDREQVKAVIDFAARTLQTPSLRR